MAVKAEQVCSGPVAITWMHVSERACCVTSRALDVSRDKVLVSCFYERKEDKSWFSKRDSQSHKICAHLHTHFHSYKKNRPHWCSGVCVCDGTNLPHQADAQPQQSGRCRRHCTRRGPAGNGSDVYAVLVLDICLFFNTKVASQNRLKSVRHQLVRQCALRLL